MNLRITKYVSLFILISMPNIVPCYSQSPAQIDSLRRVVDNYLGYLPLSAPKIIMQTSANKRLNLFGALDGNGRPVNDHNYNGIDDSLDQRFKVLADQFSPILYKNYLSAPVKIESYIGKTEQSRYLRWDTWDLTGAEKTFIPGESYAIDYTQLGNDLNEDRKLLGLLDETNPYKKSNLIIDPDHNTLGFLYIDFPGRDEKSWRKHYKDPASTEYMVYAHPFIDDKAPLLTDPNPKYEFVIQYWFFYPFNDGANNHEGDWEHVNVVITDGNNPDRLLSKHDIDGILERDRKDIPLNRLVIKRVDYYFHHYVMTLDYMEPNAYKSDIEWDKERKDLKEEKKQNKRYYRMEEWKWKEIRKRVKTASTKTHPIGFIGGDERGWLQLLSWGRYNRNSHGTYPFSGTFRNVGALGLTEKLALPGEQNEIAYTQNMITIVPDWERIHEYVLDSNSAFNATRKQWAWLVLPIRWGAPATSASPGAGIVAHANTGNLSSVGPAYNSGWNRSGDRDGYEVYNPQIFISYLPLAFNHHFKNSLGVLNLTYPLFFSFPIIDLLPNTFIPIYKIFTRETPFFYRTENPPFRRISISGGISRTYYDRELAQVLKAVDPSLNGYSSQEVSNITTYTLNLDFYPNKAIISENQYRFHRSPSIIKVSSNPSKNGLTGEFRSSDFIGNLRINVMELTPYKPDRINPFLKIGTGYNWYEVSKISSVILGDRPNFSAEGPAIIPWVKGRRWRPNVFVIGGGFEVLALKPKTRGVSLGLNMAYELYLNKLDTLENSPLIQRHHLNLNVTFSFL